MTWTIWAAMATATSSGVREPILRPIGAWMRAMSSSETPSARSRSARSSFVRRAPIAPMYPAGVSSATFSAGTSNLWSWVRTQITVRSSTGRAPQEAVGPLDDELVHVREALGRHELRASVADGDAIAEEAADRRDRGRVVDGAEDIHVRPRRERGDEDLALGRVEDRGLAPGEELGGRPGVVGADEPLGAGLLPGDRDLERDGPLLPHRLGDGRNQLRVEPVDEDLHGPAAREPDLEGLLVGDAVGLQPRRATGEHVAGLAVDGGLDAPAGHRPGDLALVGDGEDGAGIARGGALGADHGGDGDRGPVGRPALEGLEDVSHGALRPL